MRFSFRHPVSLTPTWAQQFQNSQPPTSIKAPQAGPSSFKPKLLRQQTPNEKEVVRLERSKRNQDSKPLWMIQKEVLRRNFPEGWNPPKKISRPSMTLLRTLHKTDPQQFSLPVLSEKFKISPEAVRRILKSKWEPNKNSINQPSQVQHSSITTTNTNSTLQSVDGWVHHEKSETDRIPTNLAQALQSPSHPSRAKASPILENQSGQNRSNIVTVRANVRTNQRIDQSENYELGSAFQPKAVSKKQFW